MTRRDTSIEAEGLIDELGITGKRLRQCFTAICRFGPMTRTELALKVGCPTHYVCSPCLALKKRRIFVELQKRPCSVTGFVCWEISLAPWQRQLSLAFMASDTPRRRGMAT